MPYPTDKDNVVAAVNSAEEEAVSPLYFSGYSLTFLFIEFSKTFVESWESF